MNYSLNNLEEGYSLYDNNFQYLGKSGRFQKLDENGNTKWVQLNDNPKYNWLSGKLTKSYNMGFIIENIVVNETNTNRTITF